jgi:glycosyltransferase involved in cell wall biosynthesis
VDLSVVIPVRNEERHLGEQLEALLAQEWDGEWEIIVVDNGSTDGTPGVVEVFAGRSPRIRYLSAVEKADQSYAANIGVQASDAAAIAFCDADDVVAEGWLAAMAAGLAQHDVVTGPNLLDRLNPPWLAGSRGWSALEPVGSFFRIFPWCAGTTTG